MIYGQKYFATGQSTYQVLQRAESSCPQSGWECYLAANYYLEEKLVNACIATQKETAYGIQQWRYQPVQIAPNHNVFFRANEQKRTET
jgi:hypothetical protein